MIDTFLQKKFIDACKSGDEPLAKVLAATGCIDVNYVDENGWHAIHYAALRGHESIVAGLLSVGVDPNVKTPIGQTIAHKAAYGFHDNLAELLHEKGVDFSITDMFGRSAAEISVRKEYSYKLLYDESKDTEWVSWQATGKNVSE